MTRTKQHPETPHALRALLKRLHLDLIGLPLTPGELDILRTAWKNGDARHSGVESRHLIWAVANAALRADSGLRPAAVNLLRSLATDPAFPHPARADACRFLARELPVHEHAAFADELSASRTTNPSPSRAPKGLMS